MARPAQYDCSEVLEKATQLFWEKGYRGVAISDLVQATGLLPGSLYARFGSKEGLLAACVQHYAEWATIMLGRFEANPSPLGRVRDYFLAIATLAANDAERRGCFLVAASQECDEREPAVQKAICDRMAQHEGWVTRQLDEAVAAGELVSGSDTAVLTTCLQSALVGFRVRSRGGADTRSVPAAATLLFDALMNPRRPVPA